MTLNTLFSKGLSKGWTRQGFPHSNSDPCFITAPSSLGINTSADVNNLVGIRTLATLQSPPVTCLLLLVPLFLSFLLSTLSLGTPSILTTISATVSNQSLTLFTLKKMYHQITKNIYQILVTYRHTTRWENPTNCNVSVGTTISIDWISINCIPLD